MKTCTFDPIKTWIKDTVWKQFKNDLSKYSEYDLTDNIKSICDWASSIDKEELDEINLKNFSFENLIKFVEKIEQDRIKAQSEDKRGFKEIVFGPEWSDPKFNGFTIVELDKMSQLIFESEVLDHCVGKSDTYINKIEDGSSRIFSLRFNNIPQVTIETSQDLWSFKQTFGRGNSQPTGIQTVLINEWKRSLKSNNELIDKMGGTISDQIKVAQFVSRGVNDLLIDLLLLNNDLGRESIESAMSNEPKSVLQALSQNDRLNHSDYDLIYQKGKSNKTIVFGLARNSSISDKLFLQIEMEFGTNITIQRALVSSFKVNLLNLDKINKHNDVMLLLLQNPVKQKL